MAEYENARAALIDAAPDEWAAYKRERWALKTAAARGAADKAGWRPAAKAALDGIVRTSAMMDAAAPEAYSAWWGARRRLKAINLNGGANDGHDD